MSNARELPLKNQSPPPGVEYPECPFCHDTLQPSKHTGYYYEFTFWGCDCELDIYVKEENYFREQYA